MPSFKDFLKLIFKGVGLDSIGAIIVFAWFWAVVFNVTLMGVIALILNK